MDNQTTIRPFVDADLDALYAIQTKCPQAAQWQKQDYVQLAHDPAGAILVLEIVEKNLPLLAGFAAFHTVFDETELRNIAIAPLHQRKGLGRALLAAGIGELKKFGTRRLFLEVRASNKPARAFYGSSGFRRLHIRRDYYHDPEEDALVMSQDVVPGTA